MKDFIISTLLFSSPGLIIYLIGVRDFKSWAWMNEGIKQDLAKLKKWMGK